MGYMLGNVPDKEVILGGNLKRICLLWDSVCLCDFVYIQAENTSAAKEKVSKGLNTMLDSISKALTVPPDDTGQVPITSSTAAHMFDRRKVLCSGSCP